MMRPVNDHLEDAATMLAERRARLERLLERRLVPPVPTSIPVERRDHLLGEARQLFWDELSWEQLTAEERERGSQRVERMFPGLLALVVGLLAARLPEDSGEAVPPRPGVVEEILLFLAGRAVDAANDVEPGADSVHDITCRLMDLILYRLHNLTLDEIERVEIARLEGDE